MTATLWIHRASGTDLLVRFPSAFEGYKFGAMFLKECYEENTAIHSWDESSYTERTYFNVGDSPSLQLSLHPGNFHSDGWHGLDNWADVTFVLTAEEAMTLGENGIPQGIPQSDHEVSQDVKSAFAEGTTRYDAPIEWSDWVRAEDRE
jgi:hypothetical protein